jgi:hypothetical protein
LGHDWAMIGPWLGHDWAMIFDDWAMIGPWLGHDWTMTWSNHGQIMAQSWPNHGPIIQKNVGMYVCFCFFVCFFLFLFVVCCVQNKKNKQTDTNVSHNWDMIGPWVGHEFSWLGYDWVMIGQWLGHDWTMTWYNHGPIMAPIMAQLWKTNYVFSSVLFFFGCVVRFLFFWFCFVW